MEQEIVLLLRVYLTWKKKYQEIKIKILDNDQYQTIIYIKKKILKALKIAQKNHNLIKLYYISFDNLEFELETIENFYFFLTQHITVNQDEPFSLTLKPIFNNNNNAIQDAEEEQEQNVDIIMKKAHQNKIKKQEEVHKYLYDALQQFEKNRPNETIYTSSQPVMCIFCRSLSTDLELIKQVGPLFGPFKNRKYKIKDQKIKFYYVHQMCAIWSPQVYLNSNNKLENLKKEVIRTLHMECSFCKNQGASLGCKVKTCKKNYHFKCCLNENNPCILDINNHTLLCGDHMHLYQEENDQDNNEGDLSNLICQICNIDNNDDEKIIICDSCDKGFHVYCLENKLEEIPEEDWFCSNCLIQKAKEKQQSEIQECKISSQFEKQIEIN